LSSWSSPVYDGLIVVSGCWIGPGSEDGRILGMNSEPTDRTLVFVELSRYSEMRSQLEELFGQDKAAKAIEDLNAQIEELPDQAFHLAQIDREPSHTRWYGADGIFLFEEALQASRFAAAVHRVAEDYNQEESSSLAQRHFRVGMTRRCMTLSDADRAQAVTRLFLQAAHTGEVVIDSTTLESLPPEEQELYGQGELISTEGNRTFQAYRRKVASRASWDRSEPSDVVALYIRKVEIKNIKGIEQADLDFFATSAEAPGWYVLAGGNGSGKSTFLRAIAATSVGKPLERHVDESWIRQGADLGMADVFYVSSPLIGAYNRLHLTRSMSPEFDSMPTATTLLEGGYLSGYGSFKRLAGGSDYAAKLSRSDTRLSRVLTLFLEEAALWDVPRWLERMTLDANGTARKGGVLSLLNSGLLPDGFRVKSFDEDDLLLKTPDGSTVSLRSASDGLRCMIAMVLDILRGLEDCFGAVSFDNGKVMYPGVVLIDEPDNHLHVLWQVKLASWMKEHFPRIQFIVASHSPFICVAADKIWRLDDEKGAIAPRELPESEMKELWNGSVAAVLESDAFRVFNTLAPETQSRHQEYLRLHQLSLQGRRLSAAEQGRLAELEEDLLGPVVPPDPEFDKMFP
jgi:hypothetical protein